MGTLNTPKSPTIPDNERTRIVQALKPSVDEEGDGTDLLGDAGPLVPENGYAPTPPQKETSNGAEPPRVNMEVFYDETE